MRLQSLSPGVLPFGCLFLVISLSLGFALHLGEVWNTLSM
jgi:hypothetical protein